MDETNTAQVVPLFGEPAVIITISTEGTCTHEVRHTSTVTIAMTQCKYTCIFLIECL